MARTRLTRPYPTKLLQEVLPIAETIQRVNGGRPIPTDMLAKETETSRTSSAFIQKLSSSSKYGLTEGSHGDEFVQLTELGESITAPTSPEERANSIMQAAIHPDVFRKFYETYESKRMPDDVYSKSTLVRELGVREELTDECLHLIRRNGLYSEILSEQSGYLVVGTHGSEAVAEESTGRTDSPTALPHDDRRTGQGEILLLSTPGDTTVESVFQLLDGLSVQIRSIPLDLNGGTLMPPDLTSALNAAAGCVYIWPAVGRPRDGGAGSLRDRALATAWGRGGGAGSLRDRALATAWATIGAIIYKLGRRVVVVVSSSDDPQTFSDLVMHNLTTVQVPEGGNLYPQLVPAMIKAGVVSISVG